MSFPRILRIPRFALFSFWLRLCRSALFAAVAESFTQRPQRTQRKQMGKPQKVTKKHKEQPDVTEIVMFDLPFLRPLMHSTEMVQVLAVASALVWSER